MVLAVPNTVQSEANEQFYRAKQKKKVGTESAVYCPNKFIWSDS